MKINFYQDNATIILTLIIPRPETYFLLSGSSIWFITQKYFLVSFCCSAVINFESLWETSPHFNKEYLLIVQASLVTSNFSSPSNTVLLTFFIPFLFSSFFPFLRFLSSLFCRSYLIISSLTFFLSFLVFFSLAATLHPAWWYFSVFKWKALLITSCCNIYSRH